MGYGIQATIHQPTFRKGYAFLIDGQEVFFYRTPLCGPQVRDNAVKAYKAHCVENGVKA